MRLAADLIDRRLQPHDALPCNPPARHLSDQTADPLVLNQIGRGLTEDLQTLAFLAGYGIKSFLIAQSLNQIEKAYGLNNAILDNCHVRASFATNDERTPKRVSDALDAADPQPSATSPMNARVRGANFSSPKRYHGDRDARDEELCRS